MADLDISARFILDGAKDLGSQLEAAGRVGGAVFGESLSAEAQKRLDGIVSRAEDAAKKVGLAFNRQRLRFETSAGDVVPDEVFQRLTKLNRGLAQAQKDLGSFAAQADRAARDVGGAFDLMDAAVAGLSFSIANTLTGTFTNATGHIIGSIRDMVGQFAQLDTELRKAAAADGGVGAYEKLAATVDRVGIDAAGSTMEVARLTTELIRGGLTADQVNDSLAAIVRGAEATGTGFERMGSNVAAALKIWALPAREATRVVDAMTQAANSSAASVEGLGYGFSYAGPVARQLGVSVEELGIALGLLTNAGIEASSAGVTLRNGFSKLASAAPSAGGAVRELTGQSALAAKAMRQLGVDIYETDGTLKPMETVLLRLKSAFDRLGPSAKIRLASDLFGGEDDGTKWLALLGNSTEEIQRMSRAMANTKGATDTARNAMQGFEMELKRLDGTVGSIITGIGGVAAMGLLPLVQAANVVAGAISGLPAPVKATATALVLLVGGLVAARVALIVFQRALAVTQVQEAIRGVLGLSTAIRGQLLADLARGATAFRSFTTAAAAANAVTVGSAGSAAFAGITAGATAAANAVRGLAAAVVSGALLNGLRTLAASGAAIAAGWAPLLPLAGLIGLIAANVVIWGRTMEGAKKISDDFADSQKKVEEAAIKLNAAMGKTVVTTRQARNIFQQWIDGAGANRSLDQLSKDADRLQASFTSVLTPALQFLRTIGSSAAVTGQAKVQAEAYAEALETIAEAAKVRSAALKDVAKQQDVSGDPDVARASRIRASEFEAEARAAGNAAQALRLKTGATKAEKRALEDAATAEKLRLSLASVSRAEGEARIAQLQAQNRLTKEQADNERRLLAMQAAQAERAVQLGKLSGIAQQQMQGDVALKIRQRIAELDKEIADLQIQAAQAEVERRQKAYDIAVSQLGLAQTAIELEGRAGELSAGRLRAQQQLIDSQLAFQQAQQNLSESRYGIETARQNYAIQAAETVLQRLRDQQASAGQIQQQEQYIANLKQGAANIEYRSMQAQIAAATQRFELERRVLVLKQAQQLLEARGAQRAAATNALSQQQRLLELQKQLVDPSLSGAQRTVVERQVRLQREAIGLAQQQQRAEAGRLQVLGAVFGLERQTLAAQQQTAANGMRAQAAARGWEQSLSGPLSSLDSAARSASSVAGEMRRVSAGFISAGGETVQILTNVQAIGGASNTAAQASNALAAGYANANVNAKALLTTLQRIATTPQARWSGGDVEPGNRYRINELGQESLLTAGGALSLINAPARATWTPPTRGVVLPAGITAALKAAGAFDATGMPRPRIATTGGTLTGLQLAGRHGLPGLGKIQASLERLSAQMQALAAKDWSVKVAVPSNAGLLRAVGGF